MENQTTALTTAESRAITLSARCERLDLCNPANIAKTFSAVKSQTDAIALQHAGEPCLLSIRRQGEKEGVKMLAIIKLNIAALDRFLQLKNPLGEDGIDFIAEQIVNEFGGALTFADLHVVLTNAKAGRYGNLYERLSPPVVLDWFRKYYNERLDAAFEYNLTHDTYRNINTKPVEKRVADKHKAEIAERQKVVDEHNAQMLAELLKQTTT